MRLFVYKVIVFFLAIFFFTISQLDILYMDFKNLYSSLDKKVLKKLKIKLEKS